MSSKFLPVAEDPPCSNFSAPKNWYCDITVLARTAFKPAFASPSIPKMDNGAAAVKRNPLLRADPAWCSFSSEERSGRRAKI